MTEAKKLKDVLPQREALYPDKDRLETKELLGKEILIKEANALEGEYGTFHVILFELGGKEYTTAIGSKVVNEKLKEVSGKLPVVATLVEKKSKEGRVYNDLE